MALSTDPAFLLNVTLNRDKQITGVFAGDLVAAHDAGIAFVRDKTMVPVDAPFDIVITTNSGYPLDQNLYQCGKGMSAAEQVVRPGGAVIIAAECSDGLPDHGLFGQMVKAARTPQELFDSVMQASETRRDQWAAQIQARIQLKADVYLYSDYLDDAATTAALLIPATTSRRRSRRCAAVRRTRGSACCPRARRPCRTCGRRWRRNNDPAAMPGDAERAGRAARLV